MKVCIPPPFQASLWSIRKDSCDSTIENGLVLQHRSTYDRSKFGGFFKSEIRWLKEKQGLGIQRLKKALFYNDGPFLVAEPRELSLESPPMPQPARVYVSKQHVGYIVIRHRKENRKKCSLRGLEGRPDFVFLSYPECVRDHILDALCGAIILDLSGDELSPCDHGPLLVIDGTWVHAKAMRAALPEGMRCVRRRIPGTWRTAYPRYQTGCEDPERGLASIEALYAATVCLGRDPSGLLDHYHWKEDFLRKNGLFERSG